MSRAVVLLLVLSLLAAGADFLYEKHGHYEWERWPGFHGLLALAGGALLVLLALGLGALLRRKEDYYDVE